MSETLPGGLLAIPLAGRDQADCCLLGETTSGRHVLFAGDALDGQHHDFDPRGAGGPHAETGLYL